MEVNSPGEERLCWRAWPCSACSGGHTPIGYLVRSDQPSASLFASSIEEIVRAQVADLRQWVEKCDHSTPTCVSLPKISEGSEHLVYLDAAKARVFKCTKKGIYGESYYLKDGGMNQRNCSPRDYLVRLRIWKHIFGSAPESLGITEEGQIVTFHDFITGVPPNQNEVNDFLEVTAGFIPLHKRYWLWEKPYPEENFNIVLGDARDENFVKSELGIVPIDVRLWFTWHA